jgi:drug/metabolite transporter (DMT)-like permease
VTAVGLALISASLFGAMSVGLRIALDKHPDAELATLGTLGGAFAVALVAALLEAPERGVHLGRAWPFALAGLLQPGLGQLLVTLAIREAGAARASVILGSAPVVSVTIALVLLGEPARIPLIVGAVLIVLGGIELAREPDRPAHVRVRGLVFAFIVGVLFSIRDNLVRWLALGDTAPPAVAAAVTLASGTFVLLVALGPRVRGRVSLRAVLPFLGVGAVFGLSYVSLFEAYYRGRVTVVSPLVATEALWGVGLSLIFIRRSEHVGRRVVLGAIVIVAGSALIGAFR